MSQNPVAFMTEFESIRPKHSLPQQDALEWLAQAHARAEAVREGREENSELLFNKMMCRLERYACSPEKISSRGFEVDDLGSSDWEAMKIYRITSSTSLGLGMLERSRFYADVAKKVFQQLYPEKSKAPDHLIHVTCTGYSSPSAAQQIVDERKWNGKTNITHAYHMGCYASLPAVRMAQGFIASSYQKVDIVHNEICSLHLNPLDHAPDQLVVQSLFADGHIKYSLFPATLRDRTGFEIYNVHELLIPGTTDQMSWVSADWGMKMTLSGDVPRQVASHLEGFLKNLLGPSGFELEDILKDAIFAIHPGGPRIIDEIQDLLKIENHQTRHSRGVLHQFGNMSSATLPHVWKSILEDPEVKPGTLIVSLVFGPGLTIFGATSRKI
jgi:predicted naringenin-chalcone synthase